MTEIAQLFESALRQNRANLLRKAAMNTVARMPAATTLRELLDSEAGDAIRELTLRDLGNALAALRPARPRPEPRKPGTPSNGADAHVWPESQEEQLYRRILDALEVEPLTIGQLGKRLDIAVEELRGYISWMKKMGKITSTGRARATRYRAV